MSKSAVSMADTTRLTRTKLFVSVLLTVGLLEGGAALLLRAGWPRGRAQDVPAITPSRFEIQETLSEFPLIPNSTDPDREYPVEIYEQLAFNDEAGVWVAPRNALLQVPMVNRRTGRTVRTVSVHTDAHARRVPPWQDQRELTARYHAVVFGDSMTWGYGLDGDQAFTSLLSKSNPRLVTYNVGAGGYSVGELLVRARDADALSGVKNVPGLAIYAFFHPHMGRFNNSASNAGTWRANGLAMRETAAGLFESRGPVYRAEPLWVVFAKLWNLSYVARLTGIDPPPNDRAHVGRFVRAIKALRQAYWDKTSPRNRFVVWLMPFKFDHALVRAALDHEEIEFLDYTNVDIYSRVSGPLVLPGEDHPTAEVHQLLARALARDLKLETAEGPLAGAAFGKRPER